MADDMMVLAGDFTAATRAQWDDEVLKALNRNRPPGKELTLEQAMARLTTKLVDGVAIEPLYFGATEAIGLPGAMPYSRGSALPNPAAPWAVVQLHEDGNVERTKAAVADDLDAGGTGAWLRLDPDAIAPADLAQILDGVIAEAVTLMVSSTDCQPEAAQVLLDVLASQNAGAVNGTLGLDPLAAAAVTGATADLTGLADWAKRAQAHAGLRALTVDVTPYDNAGAGDIDQLAFALATGVEYVRALTDQGLTPAEAFAQILFRVAATADEFLTVARLRALRRGWARIGEVLGVPADQRGAYQQAVTSWRVLSKDDPWVNLLRATIATFGAAVGGAEAITVLPHDTAYGLPTTHSRRIARNISLLAAEESHLGAVEDPAGGAWVFESLTEQLAGKAWARLQDIERAGGMAAALASGQVAGWIAPVAAERAKRLATRQLPLTGVSMFPKQGEEPLTDFWPRPAAPARVGLPMVRDAEVFEALRQRTRVRQADTDRQPAVILACLGAQRDFGPRQQFTSNLLLVAGLDPVEVAGATPESTVAAAHQAGTNLVILASSAKLYASQALAVAQACRADGLDVWIAGRKPEVGDPQADELIAGEIFDGMDVVAFLTVALEKVGA